MATTYEVMTKKGVVRVVRVNWTETDERGKKISHRKDFRGIPGETKTELAVRKRRIEEQYATGISRVGMSMTVRELADRWIENVVIYRGANAQRNYRQSLRDHILPVLGELKVDEVTDLDVERMVARSSNTRFDGKKGKPSTSSVGKHFDVCRNMFNYAISRPSIPMSVNPCIKGMRPPDAFFEANIIEEDDMAEFHTCLLSNQKHYVSFWTALGTSLRRSEVLGLRVKDVVPELAEISVVKKLIYVDGLYIHEEVKKNRKMGQGIRTMGIDPSLSLLLGEYIEQRRLERKDLGLPSLKEEDLFFPSSIEGDQDTAFINPDSWSDAFRACLKGTKFEGRIRPHDMRHTHATLLYRRTKDITLVQKRLGHHDPRFTMSTYANKPQVDDRATTAWTEITQSISQNNLDIIESQNDEEIGN